MVLARQCSEPTPLKRLKRRFERAWLGILATSLNRSGKYGDSERERCCRLSQKTQNYRANGQPDQHAFLLQTWLELISSLQIKHSTVMELENVLLQLAS